jgi:hypothetical protein
MKKFETEGLQLHVAECCMSHILAPFSRSVIENIAARLRENDSPTEKRPTNPAPDTYNA